MEWVSHIHDPIVLGQLKSQLTSVMSAVDSREQVLREELKPSRTEDIELLRSKLEAALQDLQAGTS